MVELCCQFPLAQLSPIPQQQGSKVMGFIIYNPSLYRCARETISFLNCTHIVCEGTTLISGVQNELRWSTFFAGIMQLSVLKLPFLCFLSEAFSSICFNLPSKVSIFTWSSTLSCYTFFSRIFEEDYQELTYYQFLSHLVKWLVRNIASLLFKFAWPITSK